jgi:hypothetical protein
MAGEQIVDNRDWPPEPQPPLSVAADVRDAARALLLEITHLIAAFPNSTNLSYAFDYAKRAAATLEDFEGDG